jgi:hypothetical protein
MANPGPSGPNRRIRATVWVSLFTIAALLAGPSVFAQSNPNSPAANRCAGDNGGIALSPGFCATIFVDNIGHVRHMAVAPNGVLYVNTWSGRYFHNDASFEF